MRPTRQRERSPGTKDEIHSKALSRPWRRIMDDIKKLEARVIELEQKLAQVTRRPEPTQITQEELNAYRKVKDLVAADFGDFCGINDCFRLCLRCTGGGSGCFRCITRCINECVCGPCSAGGFGGGFGGQFGGFGG